VVTGNLRPRFVLSHRAAFQPVSARGDREGASSAEHRA